MDLREQANNSWAELNQQRFLCQKAYPSLLSKELGAYIIFTACR